MSASLLSINDLHKSYAVPVLRGVDLDFAKSEVHALVGANGAGKTTICNIICGITDADGGEMQMSGVVHEPSSMRDAERAGIRIVMQEFNLIGNLSVAENLFFRSLPQRYGLIDFNSLFDDASVVLHDMGMDSIDPRVPLRSLGIGLQQLIEIARELIQPCRLLILDEPTAALTDPQIELLFEKIESIKAGGTAIIYISHRVDEIRRIADRVSVLRDGETVISAVVAEITTDEIVRRMADKLVKPPVERRAATQRSSALVVRELGTRDLLKNINLDIRFGEILGIAGLVGSGRTELLRAIYGADKIDSGCIRSGETSEPINLKSPMDAVAYGIGLIPEDRKQQGLLLEQSVKANVTLSSLHLFSRLGGWVDTSAEQEAVESYRKLLDIKCDNIVQIVRQLSGGNQQKVSIARWLLRDCRILLFDEPTRGIDIHTKMAIYNLLIDLARQGKAIVIVSSESRELTDLCDRIVVMSNGQLSATFDRGEWTAEKIMAASFSAYVGDNAA
ncbi:MAG: sugar ABC transporter ATP-binding protein [Proteobacteria bacterium]|nr:sugar ABC transporter ATP-binding protein [Pseudomonadota bacterium]